MPRWSPCKRQDFIPTACAELGFEGVHSGARHQFMIIGQNCLTLSSNAEVQRPMVRIMLREIEQLLGRA